MSAIAAAAGIGLALSSGYGISVAEPTASDTSPSAGAAASADSDSGHSTEDPPSGSLSHSASTDESDDDSASADDPAQDQATTDETTGGSPEVDPPTEHEPTEHEPTDADPADDDAADDDDADPGPTTETPADPVEEPTAADDSPVHDTTHRPITNDAPDTAESDHPTTGTQQAPAPPDSPAEDAVTPSDATPDVVVASAPTPTVDEDLSTPTESALEPASVSESGAVTPPKPGAIAALLTTFGIGTGGTPAPVESPSMWVALAWVRRQLSTPATTDQTTQLTSTSMPAASVTTGTTVNVKDYGAVGDGVTDDSAAIKAANAAVTSGDRLYFPEGDYRFAQQNPDGQAAIELSGLSDVTVEFAPGARLLMDNLDENGHGTSHGLRIEGAASNITILNADIEWTTAPSARSFGDGISILGYPSDSAPPPAWTGSTGTVDNVSIIDSRVVNAPQTGAVIMGASDVTVTNFTAIDTMADGLHFNANRRVTVDGLVAQNTGDDGLAFVTYYDPTQPWTYGPTDGPFNQSGVGEWNNGGSVASNITVTGGAANGVRVQGGYDINISDITVTDTVFGIQVNSAIATGPGDWTSLASRDVQISDVTIDGAQTGIVLATNNIDGTEDSKWWDFSGLTISDVTITGATNWSVAVETPATTTSRFAGLTLQNISVESMASDGPFAGGNGGILLASLHDSTVDNVRLVSDHSSDILILGAAQIRGDLSVVDLPSSNLTINDVTLEGPGRILIQDIAGLQVGDIASYSADSNAVVLFRVRDASFDNITAYLPGRGTGSGRGVQLLQVNDIDIANIDVTMDDHVGSSWWAIELGGGNPTEDIAGDGVRIENVTYVSDRDATDSDIVVQGGPYGPADWYISAHWLHNGEATPQWRAAVYGDSSPI